MREALLSAFDMNGDVLEGIYLAGRVVDVVVQVDPQEAERRTRSGLLSVEDRDLLRVLEKLPHQGLVQRADLDSFDWALLSGRGEAAVEFEGEGVRRVWKPALNLAGFVVVSRDWQTALRRVSLFAADGARGVGYLGSLASAERAAEASKKLGVGLAVITGSRLRRVVQPTTSYLRHDIARWVLAERLFRLYRDRLVTF